MEGFLVNPEQFLLYFFLFKRLAVDCPSYALLSKFLVVRSVVIGTCCYHDISLGSLRPTKLRKGNVFSCVCMSVCPRGRGRSHVTITQRSIAPHHTGTPLASAPALEPLCTETTWPLPWPHPSLQGRPGLALGSPGGDI